MRVCITNDGITGEIRYVRKMTHSIYSMPLYLFEQVSRYANES